MSNTPAIPLTEFASRRKKLLTALKKSVAVILAGQHDSHDDDAPFRPHPHFEYLTGVIDEPGAALLLDPANPIAARREVLFLPPLNPEVEKWDGYRLEIGSKNCATKRRHQGGLSARSSLPRILTASRQFEVQVARLLCIRSHITTSRFRLIWRYVGKKVAERSARHHDRGSDRTAREACGPSNRALRSKMIRARDRHHRYAGCSTPQCSAIKPGMNEYRRAGHASRARVSQDDHGARSTSPCDTIAGAGVNQFNRPALSRQRSTCSMTAT
jgi:hypothetical protein